MQTISLYFNFPGFLSGTVSRCSCFSKMYPILHVMNVTIQWENELSSSTGILVTPLILDRCYPAMTHSKCLVTAEQNAAYAALMPQTSSIQVCGKGSKNTREFE